MTEPGNQEPEPDKYTRGKVTLFLDVV